MVSCPWVLNIIGFDGLLQVRDMAAVEAHLKRHGIDTVKEKVTHAGVEVEQVQSLTLIC